MLNKKFIRILTLIAALGYCSPALAHEARLEIGAFKTVSNRFNIPNPGGSRALVKDNSLEFYGRGQFAYQLSDNGYLRFLAAPLNADYSFSSANVFVFDGVTFPANSELKVGYRFNSYRLGYIYRLLNSESFYFQVGGIGKIRQAKITVSGAGQSKTYSNVGFVPLLNLGFGWKFYRPWELRFDLDGAAAKQGRAFDGALEIFYKLSEAGSGLSGGIRILEGGQTILR